MASTCIDCAEPLSLWRRVTAQERCATCEERYQEEQRREQEQREAEYQAALEAYSEVTDELSPGADLNIVLPRIKRAMEVTPLAPDELTLLNADVLSEYLDQAVADDVLTHQEDLDLSAVEATLGVSLPPAEARRYIVAACNAGLMPREPDPRILLDPGEVAYFKLYAALLSEHVVKEYRVNYQSVSLPVGNSGARYRIGQARGRTVFLGTQIEEADQGWLVATSQRIVFAGGKEVIEIPLHRLVGLNVFGDGLGLQVANRKSVPSFRVGDEVNEVFAAVVNTAVQLDRGTFASPGVAPPPSLPTPPLPELLANAGYAETTVPARPDVDPRFDDEVDEIFRQLEKLPGYAAQLAELKAMHALGAGSKEQLLELLAAGNRVAVEAQLPPAMTPFLLDQLPRPGRAPIRDVPPDLEPVFARLQELGIPSHQIRELREDFRCDDCSELQVQAIATDLLNEARSRAASAPSPGPPPPQEDDSESAILVYERAADGSRTRQLLDVLAAADQPLTPEEIGARMPPMDDGGPVHRGSVRAAIRNLRRIEKGLTESGQLRRPVLVVDYSAYATDGANRYSLAADDKAALIRRG